MIIGQLRIGARATTYAALIEVFPKTDVKKFYICLCETKYDEKILFKVLAGAAFWKSSYC